MADGTAAGEPQIPGRIGADVTLVPRDGDRFVGAMDRLRHWGLGHVSNVTTSSNATFP